MAATLARIPPVPIATALRAVSTVALPTAARISRAGVSTSVSRKSGTATRSYRVSALTSSARASPVAQQRRLSHRDQRVLQKEVHAFSLEDKDGFWGQAALDVKWHKFPTSIYTPPEKAPDGKYRWFDGGKINTAYNCLQKNIDEGRGNQPAVIWDSAYTNSRRVTTYAKLDDQVNTLAGVLLEHGVTKGDTVIIYMPMITEGMVAMLACAKIGAVHSVVFGGFAPKELAKRIEDCKPKLILTASCGIEPNRVIPYLPLIQESFKHAKHKVSATLVFQRPSVPAVLDASKGEFEWQAEVKRWKAENPTKKVPYAWCNSDDPLYVLYTSGTTGVPKGVVREHGGHAVALKWAVKHFYGVDPGEVVFAASDMGWVVGHTFIVYAPLMHGCTSVCYEGKPITPNPGAFWRLIEEHKVSVLFTAPTALRAIKGADPHDHYLRMYDIESLRTLFVAGERCDTDTANHYAATLGVPVVDNWWQTETGWPIAGICQGLEKSYSDMAGTPAAQVKIGAAGLPMPGYDVKVILPPSEEETEAALAAGKKLEYEYAEAEEMGGIVIQLPLPPGVFRTLYNNEAGYQKSYMKKFPGNYDTTDAGMFDTDGYLHVMGRTDDIINVAGHRLSTGQMEEVVSEHPDVAETAVIGIADKLKGEAPMGFVVLKAGSEATPDQIEKELIRSIRSHIGAFACFNKVYVVDRLPKTRSGKILRKTMRSIVNGSSYVFPATIEDAQTLVDMERLFEYESRTGFSIASPKSKPAPAAAAAAQA
ncbi:propionate--CoA ligase [Gonapodya prolifera JEL478]|uniref:Propionate--CoA ligase n=1 Tax=Gonapodya prolifera (strain JEL478) TaxID=1344416 RepID=A0A139A084_GONPJ|nr:propionate--CoA ligase [Gonapodya prolifera JEL478]|eukprot:KXS10142.1 propionate--CoA ligase [Gonapodya prolifera JEL478]